MKIVRDLVISSKEPKNTNVGWLKPTAIGNYTLHFYNRGRWINMNYGELESEFIKEVPDIVI